MASFNRVILAGNLTRDPELRSVGATGTQVCAFGIAVNRKFTTASGEKREEVYFGEVEAWGKTGETIAKFFAKGKPILIEGRLKTDSWDDAETGKKNSKTRIVCESFAFIDGPRGDEPVPVQARTGGKAKAAPIEDDSIPFDHGFNSWGF